jgi:hypothetical protein
LIKTKKGKSPRCIKLLFGIHAKAVFVHPEHQKRHGTLFEKDVVAPIKKMSFPVLVPARRLHYL